MIHTPPFNRARIETRRYAGYLLPIGFIQKAYRT